MRWERLLTALILEQTQRLFRALRRSLGLGDLEGAKGDLREGYFRAHATGAKWTVLDLLGARKGLRARLEDLERRIGELGIRVEFDDPKVIGRVEGQAQLAGSLLEQAVQAGPPRAVGADARAAAYAVRWGVQQGIADVAEQARAEAGGREVELLKVWVRLASRLEHRAWHDALEGTAIPLSQKFELRGPNGVFLVDRPYDPALPLSEKVHCGHGIRVLLPGPADSLTFRFAADRIEFGEEGDNPPAAPRPSRFRPVGMSIREVITIGRDVPFSGRIALALNAISRTHGASLFPPVLVQAVDRIKGGGLAAYAYREETGAATGIEVLRSGVWDALDVVHEVGHLMDHQVLGEPGLHASSQEDGPLAEVIEAIERTPTVRRLRRALESGVIERSGQVRPANKRILSYLLKPRELFARAYAQYVAITSADPELLRLVGAKRSVPGGELWYPEQWGDEEFEPVAEAIEAILRRKRLTQ